MPVKINPALAKKRSAGAKPVVQAVPVDVLRVLRERIASSELAPGAKLNEYELAREFNVPRTRIRDVFAALEQRGLIERIPNRGAMVARLEPEQVFNMYDIREVLEGLCARRACENSDPASWRDLRDQFSGPVQEGIKHGDFEFYLRCYGEFRRRCIQAADNPLLAQALDGIYEKTQVIIRRILVLQGRAEIGAREHHAVLEAMCQGDAEAAERLRRENMRSAKAFLKRYIKYVL